MSTGASPKIALLRDSFAQRYLAWAFEECRCEVASGLSRLRQIPGPLYAGVTKIIEAMPATDQLLLFTGLLDRIRDYVGLPKVEGSRITNDLLARFESESKAWMQSPAYGLGTHEYCEASLDQSKLRATIKKELAPILGKPKGRDPSTWRYRAHIGDFTLCTEVSCAAKGVTYWHLLHAGTHEHWPTEPKATRVFEAISFLGWLGLGGPTQLKGFSSDEIPKVAQTIGEFSRYFLDALPTLVNGLSIKPWTTF